MANYAYLLALSGFRYSAPEKTLYFDPVICKDDFQCFFSVEGAWGIIRQRIASYGKVITIEILDGELEIKKVISGGKEISEDEMTLLVGDTLELG
jgi:hypothetical protein